MKTYELKSFAKINLALHVTGKLTNLHKIESVIKFIDLHDSIFIKEILPGDRFLKKLSPSYNWSFGVSLFPFAIVV